MNHIIVSLRSEVGHHSKNEGNVTCITNVRTRRAVEGEPSPSRSMFKAYDRCQRSKSLPIINNMARIQLPLCGQPIDYGDP
jgi:hypothetical protein